MNQVKKITRCGFALLTALAIMLSSAVIAYAADETSLDLSKTGSVTLTLTDGDGTAVSGGAITIYEVASLYVDDDGNAAYAYTDAFEDCTAELDVTDTSLAQTLAKYMSENDISGQSASVGTDGTVTFSDLELGLYLVVQTTASSEYETINPFVVTVPIEEDGAWVYEVDASPKVGTVTPTEPSESDDEPTTTPSTPSSSTTTTTGSTLPQTGQLYWPIPVMAIAGMLLFALGWALKHLDGKEKHS